MPLWATVRPSCRNTSKCCLRSPRSAGWAPADRLQPSALMTYRLERSGIHVSGQCHGPTAKTVGEGKKESRRFLPRPVRQRLGPWIVSHHASPPTDRKWRMWRAKDGEEGCWRGAQQLKRLSSCKLKRHYLLTWRCPLWGCTLWCEITGRERHKKEERKGGKRKGEVRSVDCGFNWK